MNGKERIYSTLEGRKSDRTAITPIFMAWASHYIGKSYRDYYLDGDILAEAQIRVAEDLGFDQVSAISDPSREAEGYGMEFEYPENSVPKHKNLFINSAADIKKLKEISISSAPRMTQRIESVEKMRDRVGDSLSVLGWIEGPIGEYADLRGVQQTMMDLFDSPEMFTEGSEIILKNAINFAAAQVQAGADMIGVGDAVASLIGPDLYAAYVLPLHTRLFSEIRQMGAKVKLHICGDITSILGHIKKAAPDVLDIDSMVDLKRSREVLGQNITLCGNISPTEIMLQGTPEQVRQAASDCIRAGGEKFILMAGCEIPPHTPVENLRALHI
jgi:MtaA/CmuA family methyltransferase